MIALTVIAMLVIVHTIALVGVMFMFTSAQKVFHAIPANIASKQTTSIVTNWIQKQIYLAAVFVAVPLAIAFALTVFSIFVPASDPQQTQTYTLLIVVSLLAMISTRFFSRLAVDVIKLVAVIDEAIKLSIATKTLFGDLINNAGSIDSVKKD